MSLTALDWQPLPPITGRIRTATAAAVGATASIVLAPVILQNITGLLPGLLLVLVSCVACVSFGAWLGRTQWRCTRWKLDEHGFHVRRGWLWRIDVLVPRSRVQHLDVERGPLERRFSLASLVVHTAGSQTPALRLSGLADADAVALRDALIPPATTTGDAL